MMPMRWAVIFVASSTMGCFVGDNCEGTAPCAPPAPPDACEGQCAPFVGGLWAPVLVAGAGASVRCPSVAPAEMVSTTTVTACGVPEADGECDDGLVCLAAEPGWSVCIVRDGAHACPLFYEAPVQAEEGVSLCCPAEEPVP
jgi:hypothetical protein